MSDTKRRESYWNYMGRKMREDRAKQYGIRPSLEKRIEELEKRIDRLEERT